MLINSTRKLKTNTSLAQLFWSRPQSARSRNMHDTDVYISDEHPLRAHIRQLLLNYAMTHFTTDYIQFTHQSVNELWCRYFVEIPTTDPNSLLLPTDPFDTLTRIHRLGSTEPCQVKFESTPSAVQYIKNTLGMKGHGKPKSDRVSFEESSFESYVPILRPMSPILTTRAMRETPRLGEHKFLKSLPPSSSGFLSAQNFSTVEVAAVLEPSVKPEDVLHTNWRLRPDEHEAVRSLLRSTVSAIRPRREYKNRHLDPCSRPASPPILCQVPEPPFIPIFPRRSRPGGGIREEDPPPSGLKGIACLPAVVLPPVKMEEIEPDLHKQNMVVVDGWQAYQSSPSPLSTPASSQEEDQVDQLFMESPDTTPPPIRPAKMEVVQIPRTRRIGGARNKPAPIEHGQDFRSFIAPLIQKVQAPKAPSRLSPDPATSMLGQPSSARDGPGPSMHIDEDDFDHHLGELYGSHRRQDLRDIILKEKVDDKRQLLMEVPVLPPPNQHPPSALFLPSNLGELVAPLKAKVQVNKNPTHKFLKKAKGIPSLNVELSWVPVAAKTRIPKHVEVIKVAGPFDSEMPFSSDRQMQFEEFLERGPAAILTSKLPVQDTWERLYGNIDPGSVPDELNPEVARCEIILSRKERRRLAGIPHETGESIRMADSQAEQENDAVEDPQIVDDRSIKRPRLVYEKNSDDSGIAFSTLEQDTPAFSAPFYADAVPFSFDADKENHSPAFYDELEYEDFEPDDSGALEHNDRFEPQDTSGSDLPNPSRIDQLQNDMVFHHEPREFEPLSFDSLQAASAQPSQLPAGNILSDETYATMFEPHPDAIMNDLAPAKPLSVTHNAPDIAVRSLGIADFAKLRAKKVSIPESRPIDETATLREEPSHNVPEYIYDRNTLRLPSTWNLPRTRHRYMVSMELVQKQALVRSLRSRDCSIDLVERDTLCGVDLILDPHTAVIFTNLLVLPSQCVELTARIGQQSWLYSRLLVVFDAYPPSRPYQAKAGSSVASELFAYTPPVLKALGKLRRDMGISEGCGSTRQACQVKYAFADTVDEAAMFTRYFGDFAEANDESQGIIWGDRTWLDDDVPEVWEHLSTSQYFC
ncbi:hypothetical protein B0H10DRAFT_2098031 [Mycena sp. CBHHK59/15]|nr:hypothetical protein B0H10DRAFT_2098031 [Mycena sp. CBHHK59/15]